jgi:hypothetical protein
MAIAVDTAQAPELLVFRFGEEWPTIEHQSILREQLRADAHLTESTRALIDIRRVQIPDYDAAGAMVEAAVRDGGLPLVCAYLVGSAAQFGFGRQLQSLSPASSRIEIFAHERDALMWLHGPA